MKGTVFKRGDTWTYVVDIGRDPKTGKRKQKSKGGFRTKKEADSSLRKLLIEVEEERYLEPSKEIFSTYFEKWFFRHYAKRVSITTYNSKKYVVKKHLIEDNIFNIKPISKITTKDIDDFFDIKLDEGLGPAYIRIMHNLLRQAFEQAKIWNMINFNPVINASPPPIKDCDIDTWTKDEVSHFLKCIRSESIYIAFVIAIYTGLRRGEVLGLKWEDIDFKTQVINIRRSLACTENGLILKEVKTKSSRRQISISPFVINELLAHKEQQDSLKKRLGLIFKEEDLIITDELGGRKDPRNLLRQMERLIKKAGVKRISFHGIRHTHATLMLTNGENIKVVADRLGHSRASTTLNFYAHSIPAMDANAAISFENFLNNDC
ncbi:tyrosine-type recombinase/integrase [Bacillus salipaludis]|uniref:Tyrosine-type recombinase/integrase n=1 Tax=Bacillus salipaludis TaxID=2547811 RepID=A0ABW8RPL2_9BACI